MITFLVFFGGDSRPDITTDGTGTWVAVWGTHSGDEFDILSAVSVNDGATWTVPAAISPTDDTQRNHQFARVATDGLGTWYAAWRLFEASFGGQLGKDSDILLSRSIDGGFSWSPPAVLAPSMGSVGDCFDNAMTLSFSSTTYRSSYPFTRPVLDRGRAAYPSRAYTDIKYWTLQLR
ncbi:MAG: sialidase family protein [Candidatus Binatia bacterium]